MPTYPPCSACGLPFSSSFTLLAGSVRHGAEIPTHLCPRCSHGTTCRADDTRRPSVAASYRTRVYDDQEHEALAEDDRGYFAEDDIENVAQARIRRVHDILQAIALVPRDRPHRVMHVGCRDGRVLELLDSRCPVKSIGLEPWKPWCKEAEARGVHTVPAPVEDVAPFADPNDRLDVIVEHHLLEHLHQPRAHLRRLHQLLADDGILIIEVPNLLHTYGPLEARFLQEHHRQVFTPRSLATTCMRAGFTPIHLDNDANMRIFCQKSRDPKERTRILPGADAGEVFSAVWANEVRLTVKRALATSGPSSEVLELIGRTHARCNWAPGRADVALEAAIALEREDRYEEAAAWLRHSLRDRPDAEVAAMLRRIEWVVRGRRSPARAATPFLTTIDPAAASVERPRPLALDLLN